MSNNVLFPYVSPQHPQCHNSLRNRLCSAIEIALGSGDAHLASIYFYSTLALFCHIIRTNPRSDLIFCPLLILLECLLKEQVIY